MLELKKQLLITGKDAKKIKDRNMVVSIEHLDPFSQTLKHVHSTSDGETLKKLENSRKNFNSLKRKNKDKTFEEIQEEQSLIELSKEKLLKKTHRYEQLVKNGISDDEIDDDDDDDEIIEKRLNKEDDYLINFSRKHEMDELEVKKGRDSIQELLKNINLEKSFDEIERLKLSADLNRLMVYENERQLIIQQAVIDDDQETVEKLQEIHFNSICSLVDESREFGVSHFKFSSDNCIRRQQMQRLKDYHNETRKKDYEIKKEKYELELERIRRLNRLRIQQKLQPLPPPMPLEEFVLEEPEETDLKLEEDVDEIKKYGRNEWNRLRRSEMKIEENQFAPNYDEWEGKKKKRKRKKKK
ncbi:hypothetical protein SNEBB_001905 [Seison nebaliae]|nr:hypothetical protein SNEBB_001905 [Seison nebaliae]